MAENETPQEIGYSFYDSLSMDELEEILRKDFADGDESSLDSSTLLHIMERLGKHKREQGEIKHSAQEAFASFQKHYLNDIESDDTARSHPRQSKQIIKILFSIAAVFAIVLITSLSATAGDFSMWNYITQWSQEQFSFVSYQEETLPPPDIGSRYPAESEQELLELHDVPTTFIPHWLPEGYELEDMQVDENLLQVVVLFTYRYNDDELQFRINSILEGYTEYFEQSESEYEVYYSGDVQFYLFHNYDISRAAWRSGSYEYSLSGDITYEQMKQIIESMEKG